MVKRIFVNQLTRAETIFIVHLFIDLYFTIYSKRGEILDNWEVYVKIINWVEPILVGVLSQNSVLHPKITRYHWDSPDILVRWSSIDLIERNNSILVLSSYGNIYKLRVGASAWRDNESKNKRRWFHYNLPYCIEFNPDLEFNEEGAANLHKAIEDTYNRIISIRENDLTLENKIPITS